MDPLEAAAARGDPRAHLLLRARAEGSSLSPRHATQLLDSLPRLRRELHYQLHFLPPELAASSTAVGGLTQAQWLAELLGFTSRLHLCVLEKLRGMTLRLMAQVLEALGFWTLQPPKPFYYAGRFLWDQGSWNQQIAASVRELRRFQTHLARLLGRLQRSQLAFHSPTREDHDFSAMLSEEFLSEAWDLYALVLNCRRSPQQQRLGSRRRGLRLAHLLNCAGSPHGFQVPGRRWCFWGSPADSGCHSASAGLYMAHKEAYLRGQVRRSAAGNGGQRGQRSADEAKRDGHGSGDADSYIDDPDAEDDDDVDVEEEEDDDEGDEGDAVLADDSGSADHPANLVRGDRGIAGAAAALPECCEEPWVGLALVLELLHECQEHLPALEAQLLGAVLGKHQPISAARRNLVWIALGAAAAGVAGVWVYRHRRSLVTEAAGKAQAAGAWLWESLVAPARELYATAFESHSRKPRLSNEDRTHFDRMYWDFVRKHAKEANLSPQAQSTLIASGQGPQAAWDMSPVLDAIADGMQSLVPNLVSGKLVNALLLQAQSVNLSVEDILATANQALESNRVNLYAVTALPAAAVLAAGVYGCRWLLVGRQNLRLMASRRAVLRGVQQRLGCIAVLLTEAAGSSGGLGRGDGRLPRAGKGNPAEMVDPLLGQLDPLELEMELELELEMEAQGGGMPLFRPRDEKAGYLLYHVYQLGALIRPRLSRPYQWLHDHATVASADPRLFRDGGAIGPADPGEQDLWNDLLKDLLYLQRPDWSAQQKLTVLQQINHRVHFMVH